MTLVLNSESQEALTDSGPTGIFSRWDALVRYRFQVLGALIVAVAIPFGLRIAIDGGREFTLGSSELTTVGALGAILVGFAILRRLMAYPGIWALSFVLPSFAFSYLLTVLVFFFSRTDYARLDFALSFALVIAWFYAMLILERRVRIPRLLLLPFGRAAELATIPGARWLMAPDTVQLLLPFEAGPVAELPDWSLQPPKQLPRGVSGVVTDLRADLSKAWEDFLASCALRGIPVYHAKQIKESLTGTVEIEHLSENTFGSLIPSSVYLQIKWFFDIVLAVLCLPVFAVVTALVAVAIKLDDGGPIFFTQRRVGYRGKPFVIFKFRTMCDRKDLGPLFTLDGDDRITRVGRYLRHYRIDELPQILNILRGEMSWIGPRPEAVPLSQWYASKIPFYVYRHIVRPGITGWAAVNQGNVAELPAATGKLHYDFFYIKNFSPWLDLLITARTLAIVLTGFGSR